MPDEPRELNPFMKMSKQDQPGATTMPFQRYAAVDGDLAGARLRAIARHPSTEAPDEAPSGPESGDMAGTASTGARPALTLVESDADALANALAADG